MRRSAAPSQFSNKRTKFCTPYSSKSSNNNTQDNRNECGENSRNKDKSSITESAEVNIGNTKLNDMNINQKLHKKDERQTSMYTISQKTVNSFKVPSRESKVSLETVEDTELEEMYFSVVWYVFTYSFIVLLRFCIPLFYFEILLVFFVKILLHRRIKQAIVNQFKKFCLHFSFIKLMYIYERRNDGKKFNVSVSSA